MKKKIVAIIPARGGSERIKNKNIKFFFNKPLIVWTILAAKKSKFIDEIYVTSDDFKILKISKKYGIGCIKRPKSLSNDIIMPDAAVLHAFKKIGKVFDYIVTLQPTSPLRQSTDIDRAIAIIIKNNGDSLLSGFKTHPFIWKKIKNIYKPNYNINKRPRSQDFERYQENGSIYITKSKIFIKNKNRLGGKIIISEMDRYSSLDIDTIKDFRIAELILKHGNF
jgi:CMP-N,N'-diacetyllegionaminic acid synthase